MTIPTIVVAEYVSASNTNDDGFRSTTIPTAIAIVSPAATDNTTTSMTATNDRLSTQRPQQASCRVLEVIDNDTNYGNGTTTIATTTVTNSNGTLQLQQAVPTTDSNNNNNGNDDASVSSQSSAGTIVHPPTPLPKYFYWMLALMFVVILMTTAIMSKTTNNSSNDKKNKSDDNADVDPPVITYVPIDRNNPVSVACNFLRYTNISICQRVTSYSSPYGTLMGSIPTEIGLLTQLQTIDISNQRNISGTIPSSLYNLRNLTELILAHNDPQLFGMTIPSDIGNLIQLTTLFLEGNQLSGTIPSSIGNLVHLKGLYLAKNRLSGTIPLSFRNLAHLWLLYLDNNQLTGSIPITTIFSSLVNLTHIRIQSNPQFGGGTISSSQCALFEERNTMYYIDCEPPQLECSCCFSGKTDRLCPS